MIEKKRTFGVLDTDRSPKLIEQGDYTYALNIRNSGSAGEQVGVIEPIRGSEKKQFNLPAGINECTGQYSHDEDNHIYFFIWNSNQIHQIVRYSYQGENFQVVLRTPELKFDRNHHIVEANIIGGQLFFNDAWNEVRRLDIAECLQFVDSQVWNFQATAIQNNQVVLEGTSPPPFTVGQTITIVREWREPWLDVAFTNLGEGGELASYHQYDPNPEYSGEHVVLAINGNDVILTVPPTGVQDFVQDINGNESFVPGHAYPHQINRAFTIPFQENFIKLYRSNPAFPVVARYGSDEKQKTNNLRGRLFQFKTRFVYPNGMRSVPSPICKIPLPRFEQNIAFQDLPVWWDNYIDLWFDTGTHDVLAVEILVRESSSEGNKDWAVVGEVDKIKLNVNSNTSYNLRFFGDEVMVTVPVAEGEQPMDYIPHVGHAFCFIRDKRDAIGGCEEGFDHVDAEVEIEPLDLMNSALTLFEIRIDENTTLNNVPVSESIRWPLNKLNSGFGETVQSGPMSTGGTGNSFYAAQYSSIPGVTAAYSFSYGSPFSFEFPDGWQQTEEPGNNNSGDGGSGYVVGDGWSRIDFGIIQSGGQYGNYNAAGSVAVVKIEYRISKFLVCRQQQGSEDNIVPDRRVSQGATPNWYQVSGVVAYSNFDADPEDSYWNVSETFIKELQPGDTAISVRNHFINVLSDTSNNLHTQRNIILSRYGNNLTPQSYGWKSKRLDVDLYMEVESIAGLPTGQSALRFRPRVTIPSFNTADDGSDASIGTISLWRMSQWYGLLGINRVTTRAQVVNTDGNRGFKTGASHPLVLEYRDSVGRRATLSPCEAVYIPYFNEGNPLNSSAYSVALLVRIFNAAPQWATHYQFYYSGNATMQDWITFEVNWIDSSEEGVKIALSQRLSLYNKSNNLGGASNMTDSKGRSSLAYSWSRGDRLRFLTYWTGDQDSSGTGNVDQDVQAVQYVDVEIIGEATDNSSSPENFAPFGLVVIVSKSSILPYINEATFGRGSLIEVYTPKQSVPEDLMLYYEIGECFKVSDGAHWGNRLNQFANTPGSDNPYAEVLIKNNGDAYAIGRKKLPDTTRSRDRLVESSSFSDFYPSYGWGPGTANRVNFDARRELKKELIRYSDFLIGDANGLNRYFDGNVSDEPDVLHGLIQRMECPDTNLYVFQELSTGVVPIRALQLTTASGQSEIMRSDNVIGNIQYIPGNFGIGEQRESLVYWGGVFYFASIANGLFLRLSGSQFEAISKKKKDNYWNTVFEMISRSRTKVRVLSEFDPKYGELIVYIPPFYVGAPEFGTRPDFEGVTIAYSEQKEGWVTRYSFEPEVLGRHRNKLVSWKQGQLYVHDKTENWNQYYDNEPAQRSTITLSFNSEIDAVKFLQSILVECTREPDEIEIETDYGAGQITGLFKDDFRYSENQYSAAILRDENSPGGILSGDVMRGESCLVTVEFDPTDRFKLFSVNLRYQKSEMTDR